MSHTHRIFPLCLVFLLVLTACRQTPKRYVIGVSQCSEDIWRDKLNDELVMGTYQHENVTLKFASANDDDKLQSVQIQQFVNEGVDLLIVSPNQMHTAAADIKRAYEKGIPVILFDRKTASNQYTAFIGADNLEAGRVMGDFIARQLHGRGTVVEILGLQNSSPTIDRHKGFVQAISRYPGIKLIDKRYAGWLKDRAERAMDSVLTEHRHIDFVFGQNDRMAIGALQAAERRGIRGIRFVGIDALPVPGGGLENVRDGRLLASYIYPTRGDLVMQLALNILEKRPYRRDNYLRSALVTRDNANVMLIQSEEMNKLRSRLYSLHGLVDSYLARYNHQKIYLLLFGIITLLLIGLIVYIYRTIVIKQQLKEEATNAKLQFFTNVSHELRTPLTLIADPVDHIIADSNLTRQQRNMLQIVRRNTGVLSRLVDEILDFRKIQSGKMALTLSDFDLSTYMQQWLNAFSTPANRKHITLELQVADSISIRADLYKMERICYNLLSNALKYTDEGGRIIFAANENDETVCIRVADNGAGISKNELPHIFDRFYQTCNPRPSSTGIGLAIVHSFVELQGGRVTVESELGSGTTFIITLPKIVQGVNIASATDVHTLPDGPFDDTSARDISSNVMTEKLTDISTKEKPALLIIDDNEDIRAYLMALLSNDYDVSQAADGQMGLQKAMRDIPDIIICDVMMPGLDGLALCKRIKTDILTSHIPIILITARTLEEQRVEGYNEGADAYLTKPFSSEVLKARIRNLLESRRQLKYHVSNTTEISDKPLDADTQFIANFRQIVLKRLSDSEFSVETASAAMGLSRVQLYRKVKALTGSSPVELIRITRLKQAEQLLRTTSKTIAEIAYDVGFSFPSYFSKCYKDYFGRQPGGLDKRTNSSPKIK